MQKFTDLHSDVLSETINIAMNKAAGSLCDITGEEISLQIPRVNVLSAQELNLFLSDFSDGNITLVKQTFESEYSGTASLFFPVNDGMRMARLMLDDHLADQDLADLEDDAFQEVGNIILNCFLGTMGNQLGMNMSSNIPTVHNLKSVKDIVSQDDQSGEMLLLAQINFDCTKSKIKGYLLLSSSIESIDKFIQVLDGYLENLDIAI